MGRVCCALFKMIIALAMIFTLSQSRAAQLPAGCTANALGYDIQNLFGLVNITNCTVVTFVTTIDQPNVPSTCNIVLSTNGLKFFCPDAGGNSTGSSTTLIPGGTTLPPGLHILFTNQCTICVTSGVHTAQVRIADNGSVVQDNPLQDDPAAILKTLSVNIFNPCIKVTKVCNGGPFPYGSPISFVGTVTNCGDIALTGVTVYDDHAGILLTNLVLQPGQGTNFSANYVPTGNLCGPFTNNVLATGIAPLSVPAVVSSTAQAVCTVVSSPCIGVTKTCPGSIPYGTTSYVIGGVVTNCGNVPLVGVVVVDNNATTNVNDDITINIGTLAAHASAAYTATNTVPVTCGPFTDRVVATGTGLCGGVVNATNNCTTTVTTAPCIGVTKICPSQALPIGTTSFVVSGVVTNCGNVLLTNVVVVDNNGTTNTSADDIIISIGNLAAHGSAPWIATNTVPNGFCGPVTDQVTASGKDACSGQTVQNSASCTTSILCPVPRICVTKGITCAPATGIAGCDSSLTYAKVATGVAGTNQTAFCYKIVVSNCGLEPLTNVTVIDNLLPQVSGSFPSVLSPGQAVTNYYGQSYGLNNGNPSTNVNTVVATGTGSASGIITNAQDSATAIVLPIKVQCNILLYSSEDLDNTTNNNHVTLPAGTTNAPVEFELTVCNTGQADLNVSLKNLPPLVSCADDVTPINVPATTNIPAGQCIVISGCVLIGCPGLDMQVTVQGTAVASQNIPCIYDSQGRAVATAASSCAASVDCQTAVTCRVTGGGTLYDGDVSTNCINVVTTLYDRLAEEAGFVVDHISHGGQLGAPFSQMDCAERLANPCIRGEWQHVRHYDAKQNGLKDVYDMSFHSANPNVTGHFDTLMCACLPCCGDTNGYKAAPPGWDHFRFEVCNKDDRRICGPLPRPAPANAIIFTGIGTITPNDSTGSGRNAQRRYVVFRVYIEDRSEPGGIHPKGGNMPATVYCFQAWDTGIATTKKAEFSTLAKDFRIALGEDSCAFLAALSNGNLPQGSLPSSTVMGVPADTADQGALRNGSQQIHPSTSATCNQ